MRRSSRPIHTCGSGLSGTALGGEVSVSILAHLRYSPGPGQVTLDTDVKPVTKGGSCVAVSSASLPGRNFPFQSVFKPPDHNDTRPTRGTNATRRPGLAWEGCRFPSRSHPDSSPTDSAGEIYSMSRGNPGVGSGPSTMSSLECSLMRAMLSCGTG
jgi:hypothetical protein